MIKKCKADQLGVYVIGAHRLLLCTQLMDDLRDICIKCGLPVNVLYIGSARHDDKIVYDRYFSQGIDKETFESSYTTDKDEVSAFHAKTKQQKRHLIIVSTYHSFDKLAAIESIDICTYDEAHTTIADDFMGNIQAVMPLIKRNYFFTATQKVCGEDGGMNDENIYGPILCGISPREMVEAGEIIMPKIHIIRVEGDEVLVSENNEKMLVKTVIEAFKEHKNILKKDSAFPGTIGAKLLVSAKGSDEIEIIQNSATFKEWCATNNVKVFSFSSRFGSFEDFENDVNRNRIYESMRGLKDTDDCILLHIDILTEGIDLPSITGVMLLRHLNIAKLLQTLGRALRLLKSDRHKLYQGHISPKDRSAYTKPYAYMILPMHFETLAASSEEMKEMIRGVITEYGLPTEEFLPIEKFEAMTAEYLDPVTDIKDIKKREKEYPLIHLIEEFVIEQFKATLPTDNKDKYETLVNILSDLEGEKSNA
jgi:hypothetical protein